VQKAGKGGMAAQELLYRFLAKMTNRAVVFALLRYLCPMNSVRNVLPILAGLLFLIGAAPKPPVLFRAHLQAPEGSKGQASVPVTLFNPAETISIQTIPEVSEKEVRKVSTRLDGSILVEFTDFGQTKLEVGTSTGRGLILVVIVNGRVVYAPRIDTVLTNGCLLLPAGSITLEEMAQMNGDVEHTKEQRLKDLPRSG